MLFQVALFVAGSVTYSLLSFLPNLAKVGKTDFAFDAASVVFFAELGKLFLSLLFLFRETNKSLLRMCREKLFTKMMAKEILSFMVPTVLYAINNNLDIILANHMDGVTQQVLLQNKILVTSLVWWVVFRKHLEPRQWFALLLLTAGSAIAVSSGEQEKVKAMADDEKSSSDHSQKTTKTFCTPTGFALAFFYCLCSAGASIYCEYVYRRDAKQSVHVASAAMYIGGLVVNNGIYMYNTSGITASASPDSSNSIKTSLPQTRVEDFKIPELFLFRGWNVFTVLDCGNKALLGLTLGYVMRYLGNLHKLFMFGASMFCSAVLGILASVFLPNHPAVHYSPTIRSVAGMTIVLVSLVLFNYTELKSQILKNSRKKMQRSSTPTSVRNKPLSPKNSGPSSPKGSGGGSSANAGSLTGGRTSTTGGGSKNAMKMDASKKQM
ncbi:unnamed protein product [Amoebophrya sp. A120]|nr:unnamed protein product [Amoebophrya sp. A120]|eukprot:GSA120T00020037001.1